MIAVIPGVWHPNLLVVLSSKEIFFNRCVNPRALLDGKQEIATWALPNGCMTSLQADIDAAKDTMSRIRLIETKLGAHIALAHDTDWIVEGNNSVLMSLLDQEMKESAKSKILAGEII